MSYNLDHFMIAAHHQKSDGDVLAQMPSILNTVRA